MSTSLFRVQEHTVPCQHIRHYPHATKDSQETVLHLSVKQYTPLENLHPRPGDITIIGAHANGFPKVTALQCINIYNVLTCAEPGALRAAMG